MSYQALSEDEVYGLYEEVCSHLSVPLCVYDNTGTTHFTFSDELHGRIASLPGVASIKIPGVPQAPDAAQAGEAAEALRLSEQLRPLWNLFRQSGGSLRVVASAVEILRLVSAPCLPSPLKALTGKERHQLSALLDGQKLF